jgi:RsiW-degrading membrane proteinase PrsW (M82 family)
MVLSLIIGLFQFAIDNALSQEGKPVSQSNNILLIIFFYFLVVSVTEETGKLAVTYFTAYRHVAFNEQIDGIIYAAASGLGFATFENIFFILDQGPYILLLRGPISTLGHVLFSAMWGAALGLAKFDRVRATATRRIFTGLVLAIVTHAIFDLIITLGLKIADWVSLFSIVFLGLMYLFVSRQISRLLHLSQFRPATAAINTIRQLRQQRSTGNDERYVPNPYLKNKTRGDKEEEQDK